MALNGPFGGRREGEVGTRDSAAGEGLTCARGGGRGSVAR